MILYSVFDAVAAKFNAPFSSPNDASAKRDFGAAALDSGTLLNKYPYDYMLYRVGTLDDESGTLTPELPVRLCSAADYVRKETNDEV